MASELLWADKNFEQIKKKSPNFPFKLFYRYKFCPLTISSPSFPVALTRPRTEAKGKEKKLDENIFVIVITNVLLVSSVLVTNNLKKKT